MSLDFFFLFSVNWNQHLCKNNKLNNKCGVTRCFKALQQILQSNGDLDALQKIFYPLEHRSFLSLPGLRVFCAWTLLISAVNLARGTILEGIFFSFFLSLKPHRFITKSSSLIHFLFFYFFLSGQRPGQRSSWQMLCHRVALRTGSSCRAPDSDFQGQGKLDSSWRLAGPVGVLQFGLSLFISPQQSNLAWLITDPPPNLPLCERAEPAFVTSQ